MTVLHRRQGNVSLMMGFFSVLELLMLPFPFLAPLPETLKALTAVPDPFA